MTVETDLVRLMEGDLSLSAFIEAQFVAIGVSLPWLLNVQRGRAANKNQTMEKID